MTIIGNNYIYNHTLSQEKLSLLCEEPQSTLAEPTAAIIETANRITLQGIYVCWTKK